MHVACRNLIFLVRSTPPSVNKENDSMTSTTDETGADDCCANFDSSPYDQATHVWTEKTFVKESLRCFLYIPFNYGGAIERAVSPIKKAHAMPATKNDFLCLDDMYSPWKSNIYVACTKEDVPGAEVVKISGKFLTKVYEGPYKNMGNWIADMKAYTLEKSGVDPVRLYAYYTTCPKCSEKYGKNPVVIFAQVSK